jgi:hypothetical protein
VQVGRQSEGGEERDEEGGDSEADHEAPVPGSAEDERDEAEEQPESGTRKPA